MTQVQLSPEFLTPTEESWLLKQLLPLQWQQVKTHGRRAERQVLHFGFQQEDNRRLATSASVFARKFPGWMEFVLARVARLLLRRPGADIVDVLATYYPPGAGIGWHREADVFGDEVAGISLLGHANLRIRPPEGKRIHLPLPPRSAYVLSGQARWVWEHSLSPQRAPRVSLTFRTLGNLAGLQIHSFDHHKQEAFMPNNNTNQKNAKINKSKESGISAGMSGGSHQRVERPTDETARNRKGNTKESKNKGAEKSM